METEIVGVVGRLETMEVPPLRQLDVNVGVGVCRNGRHSLSKTTIRHSATPVAKAQEASYRASLHIAKADKPHTIGEELCLPLAKEIKGIMCGEKAHEDFLFCQSLQTRTTAENIFQLVNAFFQESGLDWKNALESAQTAQEWSPQRSGSPNP